MFPFYKLKIGIFLFFLFSKFLFSLQKEEDLQNKQNTNPQKTHFYKFKTGPIMLRNILGPFLTYTWTSF